jgi:hydroxyethylthiazole kinase
MARERGIPLVLDPVFVELSPLRMRLAREVLRLPGVTVRGNAAEMAALDGAVGRAEKALRVTTGEVDRIEGGSRPYSIRHGHSWMTRVTGLGCASSALVAACRAVEPDAALAAAAALTAYGIAGEIAAERAQGPGSFAIHLIDALAGLDEAVMAARMV